MRKTSTKEMEERPFFVWLLRLLISLVATSGLAIFTGVAINYLWDRYSAESFGESALQQNINFRGEFRSDDLRKTEIQTSLMTGFEHKTRIVLVQNLNYFDKDPSSAYSGLLFYDYDPSTKKYEESYKFMLQQARGGDLGDGPLMLESAELGDLDGDGVYELATRWSVCGAHCVMRYPIVFGFDGGYYVKWTMPSHQLTKHDVSGDYWWGGQRTEMEVVNLHDSRKYILHGGNRLEYKKLGTAEIPYVVSHNIDNESCWACDDHTYLLDVFSIKDAAPAKFTFHGSSGLIEHFREEEIETYDFVDTADFQSQTLGE
jgi:hypothetical protein